MSSLIDGSSLRKNNIREREGTDKSLGSCCTERRRRKACLEEPLTVKLRRNA